MANQRTRRKRGQRFHNQRTGTKQAEMLREQTKQNAQRTEKSKLAPKPVTPKQMEQEQTRHNSGARTSVYVPDALVRSGDGVSGNPGRRSGPGPFSTKSTPPKGKFKNPLAPGGYERRKKTGQAT